MPSSLHEAIAALFRFRPSLAPELMRDGLGVELPAFDEIALGPTELGELVPSDYRADVVLVTSRAGVPRLAMAIEVQLACDARKRFTWPLYQASLRARHECPAVVLVVAVDERVAAWCAEPIDLGPTGDRMKPLVLGPSAVPIVTDTVEAGRSPALALLSAMAHAEADAPIAERTAITALDAALTLDADRFKLYAHLVLRRLPDAVRSAVEEQMWTDKDEYDPSDFVERLWAMRERVVAKALAEGATEGRAKGRAEGLTEGRARGHPEALCTLLEARGVPFSEAARERIAACTDVERLDRWLIRAATAATADEATAD